MYAGERPSAASLGNLGQWATWFSRPALSELAAHAAAVRRVDNRALLFSEQQRRAQVLILHKGWACAYRDFSDGRRHVAELYIPGDIVGLTEVWAGSAGPAVATLTEVQVAAIERDALVSLVRQSPEVADGVATTLAQAADTLSLRLGSLARHTAYERVATLLWSLRRRMRPENPAELHSFPCPVSQSVISDALGLSAVHVNRSLRQLARDGVLRKHALEVEILDNAALERIVHW